MGRIYQQLEWGTCWMGMPGGGKRAYEMVKLSLEKGYRHFDTADGYDNEEQVGKAIKDSGIPRSEIYITTKLNNVDHHRVQEAFAKSLQKLDTDYIDLYLMHWPQASIDGRVLNPEESPTIIETWKEMEKLLQTGKVKAIGVSNFSIKTLMQLLPHCIIIPATNQVELHPYLPSTDLKEFCEKKGILLTAYSPLGRPTTDQTSALFADVLQTAQAHKANPAQVLLNWAVQKNIIVVPKTENPERMSTNISLIRLSDEEIRAIDELHKQPGKHRSLLAYHNNDPGRVFGWTYEQLGWDMVEGGIIASK
ncbi:aado keto reductase [Moniliophthora roreri]|uniref:Putative Aldo/keto reductase n=1 Tax=Moniliophthora roreri TaxID=221103 RepID=A0A0W0EX40_MONRR|nr:aado keto reductase [Moniliophthora roreri]